jgi:hypothetical protein
MTVQTNINKTGSAGKVILSRVRANIVAMEKQYVLYRVIKKSFYT